MSKKEKEFEYLVYIGRFQPFHKGHLDVIQQALQISENIILVMGSHDRPRDIRNPFTTEERKVIITAGIGDDDLLSRIHYVPQVDHPYNEGRWISDIQSAVRTITLNKFNPDPIKIGIVGYNKDHSSYYLKKFPAWKLVEIIPKFPELNATDFRKILFYQYNGVLREYLTSTAHKDIIDHYTIKISPQISEEWDYIERYRDAWKNSPYPVTLMTVDSIVSQSGHLLVVERGTLPGKGLIALPGGYINVHETLKESALRELKEETKIDVPLPVLAGSVRSTKTYDDPRRSARGRIITQAFDIRLNDNYKLPKVKGADDARKAWWMPFSEVVQSRNKFFEDHFDLIEDTLGL